jgi:hypothetical protein
MAGQQAIQGALLQHERVRKSTDLPNFYGNKEKDVVEAQDFLDRFEIASNIARWVPAPADGAQPDTSQKCEQFYMLLRGQASDWWKSLSDIPDFNYRDWNAVRPEFIASYCPRYTARTACLSFGDLVQRNGESVHDFYLRVSRAYQLLKDTRYPEVTDLRLAQPDLAAEDGRADRVEAFGDAAKLEGVEDMGRYIIQQLFTAGLHEEIRIKTMEADTRTLHNAYRRAMVVETIIKDKRGSKPLVTQIAEASDDDEEPDQDDEDEELLEQVNAIRISRGKRPIRFSSRPKGKLNVTCRYCKKNGHFQRECRKRISERAPLLDQHGKAYTPLNNGKIHTIEEEESPTGDRADINSIDAAHFYGINAIQEENNPLNYRRMF